MAAIPCTGCERREACELIERCLDKSPLHDDYKPLDLSQIASVPPNGGAVLEPCPVCGGAASLWQYSTSETAPRKLLVCCTHSEPIGPQDGLANEGCPLYMPPDNFYRETIRDAVRYWNEFARALGTLQAENAERNAGIEVTQPAPSVNAKLLDLAQFFVSNHDQITPADIQRAKAVIAEALGGSSHD